MGILSAALDAPVLHVGRILTEFERPPDRPHVLQKLEAGLLLDEIDILFSPGLKLDLLRLLRDLSRYSPRIARWPGSIEGGRAIYSELGRRDHYEAQLSDAVIIRPKQTKFPDEVPFEIERIP